MSPCLARWCLYRRRICGAVYLSNTSANLSGLGAWLTFVVLAPSFLPTHASEKSTGRLVALQGRLAESRLVAAFFSPEIPMFHNKLGWRSEAHVDGSPTAGDLPDGSGCPFTYCALASERGH